MIEQEVNNALEQERDIDASDFDIDELDYLKKRTTHQLHESIRRRLGS